MTERNFDVIVVGGGPAGLAAAGRAGEAGRSVAVIDDNPVPGGQIWRADRGRLAPAARHWIHLLDQYDVEILGATTIVHANVHTDVHVDMPVRAERPVQGSRTARSPNPKGAQRSAGRPQNPERAFPPGPAFACTGPAFACKGVDRVVLGAIRDGKALRLRAARLILATGAQERFLPFPGWTRPGVFGVGGLQALVKGGWDISGQRVVVAGSGPLLLAVASALRRRGAQVVCVAEQAPLRRLVGFGASLASRPGKLIQLAALEWSLLGIARHYATQPVQAVGDDGLTDQPAGDGRIRAVILRSASGRERTVECDALACGFGLVPDTRLASLLGCDLAAGCVNVNRFQETTVPGVFCAGESTGIGGVDLARVEGEIAGLAATGQHHKATDLLVRRDRERRFAAALDRAFTLRPELRALPADDTVVCRCEDTTWGQIRGRDSLRDAKLHGRCGMGPCQGRVCGPALEFLRGFSPARPRPPLFPVPLGLWAELSLPAVEDSVVEDPVLENHAFEDPILEHPVLKNPVPKNSVLNTPVLDTSVLERRTS